jgi:hypothetical protein
MKLLAILAAFAAVPASTATQCAESNCAEDDSIDEFSVLQTKIKAEKPKAGRPVEKELARRLAEEEVAEKLVKEERAKYQAEDKMAAKLEKKHLEGSADVLMKNNVAKKLEEDEKALKHAEKDLKEKREALEDASTFALQHAKDELAKKQLALETAEKFLREKYASKRVSAELGEIAGGRLVVEDHGLKIEDLGLKVENLAWLHIPKTGTSFANILLSYFCPDMPEDVKIDRSYSDAFESFVPHFMSTDGRKYCPTDFNLCSAGHKPIQRSGRCMGWSKNSPNFVAMFRQPEQRIISGFRHNLHDCSNKKLTLPEYARRISGTAVRMMNGYGPRKHHAVNSDMVDTALHRLETGFASVGLTEEWSLSVCLFHKMLGGKPQKRDFLDVRPGVHHKDEYDISGLENYTDPFDGPVYESAKKLFWSNVNKFNATQEACHELCRDATDYFSES